MKTKFITPLLLIVLSLSGFAGEIEHKVDSLFVLASSGELKYRAMVAPAIDSLAAMGNLAVPRLIDNYDTQNARERQTISTILEKIGSAAVPDLILALSGIDPEKVSRICYSLGKIKDSTAVAGLMSVAFHGDWRVRSNSAVALGEIGDHRADDTIIRLLADINESVRKSAVVATGSLSIFKAVPILINTLGDSFYGARLCASESLTRFPADKIVPLIADSLNSANELIGNLGCITLGLIGGDSAAAIVSGQLHAESSLRRALAAEAIYLSNSSVACGAVELLKKTETDPMVLFFFDKVLKKYASR